MGVIRLETVCKPPKGLHEDASSEEIAHNQPLVFSSVIPPMFSFAKAYE